MFHIFFHLVARKDFPCIKYKLLIVLDFWTGRMSTITGERQGNGRGLVNQTEETLLLHFQGERKCPRGTKQEEIVEEDSHQN